MMDFLFKMMQPAAFAIHGAFFNAYMKILEQKTKILLLENDLILGRPGAVHLAHGTTGKAQCVMHTRGERSVFNGRILVCH